MNCSSRLPYALTLLLGGFISSTCAAWYDLPDGGSGFKLLKLDASPRALALSGAGVGNAREDPIQNAATDSVEKTTLAAGYGSTYSRLEGSLQQASWIVPSGSWTWNALARFEGFSDLPGRDEEDRRTGTYSASSWALDAGLALPTGIQGLRAGVTLGAGMDGVSDALSWAGWMSLGASYRPIDARWSIGATLRNLGVGTTSGDHREDLPAIFQTGAAWHQTLGNWTLVPIADLKIVADEDLQFPLGLEVNWNILSLRTGFVVGRSEFLPSMGLGMEWDGWILDAGTSWHQALGFAPAARLGIRI